MRHFIFDVDGTLTPSRDKMDPEFKKWFIDQGKKEYFYVVTGSNYEKTFEQMGSALMSTQICYNCSGNSVHLKGVEVYKSEWTLPSNMEKFLEGTLERHPYAEKTGNHIEHRPGLVNFSVVGRNADKEQRQKYVQYDEKTSDREIISNRFNKIYAKHGVLAQIAGETGIDIMPIGAGKSQILTDFNEEDVIYFFGDKCSKGGNDYDIAESLKLWPHGKVYHVKDWTETFKHLREIISE